MLLKIEIFILLLAFPILLTNSVEAQQQDNKFLPFFDNEDNPVPLRFPPKQQLDISPPPPKLNAFDQAVLNICGSVGTRVKPSQFQQLLSYYPDVLEKLQKVSGGELRSGRREKSEFLQDLTTIWFQRRGFEHIFCGEIYNENDIGGLHFYGRYLQLQSQGIGGRLPNNQARGEVVPGVIYTMGVIIQQGDRIVKDEIKGYGYLSNAQEILLDATKIFKLQGNRSGACIYNVQDWETGKTFPTVFVKKEQAIITFYPDATPEGEACKR
ncbi:EndoU domain-containing protein [Chlorogloeopsis sp. ULAP01]|uniref:EndoU domain-containing protein n=1 Tax=Chlorogloeopsis sp. ULAP01 TaxID=3056483 RepID=UPI0025AA7509|nr:EndoU domain-containing protein [Chlorogloeopsis sp. ULAP01]MDM9385418.1 EndoU domain-containing protein [Chlorogloeopsis sp. ULAP01]